MFFSRGEKTRDNFFRILRAVWLSPHVSRVDLSRVLNLDKATVSNLVSEMLETKIIVVSEKKKEETKIGRKPEGLSINTEFGFIVGFDIQHDRIALTAIDLQYNRIVSSYYDVAAHKDNLDIIFIDILRDFLGQDVLRDKFILGMGVGTTGVVDVDNQLITKAKPLGITDSPYDFKEKIVNQLDIPVYLSNDANCCASGILVKYRDTGLKNFIFLYLIYRPQKPEDETNMRLGMGIGIVLNGIVYRGEDGTAGEFRSFKNQNDREVQFNLTTNEINSLKEDESLRSKLAREIASNIALIVNITNFKNVFIGGDTGIMSRDMRDILKEEIGNNWPYPTSPGCRIRVLEKQEDLISFSAAGMFLQHLFSDPGETADPKTKTYWWETIFNHEIISTS